MVALLASDKNRWPVGKDQLGGRSVTHVPTSGAGGEERTLPFGIGTRTPTLNMPRYIDATTSNRNTAAA